MSMQQTFEIACPACEHVSEQTVWQSINDSVPDAALRIINGEINFLTCPECGNGFLIEENLLYTNPEKKIALHYMPYDPEQTSKGSGHLKKQFGEDYMANPIKFTDWDEFIAALKKQEGIGH